MCKILIFGGTSEGRELAEFCAERKIGVFVSVTTDYGAELLPKSKYVKIRVGKLDLSQMKRFLSEHDFDWIVDATHPYASLATENIALVCKELNKTRYRLVRKENAVLSGKTAENIDEIINELNRSSKRVLSTLGSKELPYLKKVKNAGERFWIRVLPTEGIAEYCESLGFGKEKILLGKGPFSVGDNIEHIRRSGAEILLTKESGAAGGYPQKVEAARVCGIELITLKRPRESGFTMDEIKTIIVGSAEK